MRTIITVTLLALSLTLLGTATAEDGDTPDDSFATLYCVAFTKAGDPASQALEKSWLAKLRAEFADKNVLFINADVSSRGSRHQAKLLLNSLSLEEVWRTYAAKPGHVVLSETDWGKATATLDSKTTLAAARAALAKALAGPSSDMDEEGDDDDDDDDD